MKTTVQVARRGTLSNYKNLLKIIYGFSFFVIVFSIVFVALAIQLHDWRETTTTGDAMFGFNIVTIVFLSVSFLWVLISMAMEKGLRYTNSVSSLSDPINEWRERMEDGIVVDN